MTHYLVLLRHGQSEWNLANKFTGFHDVDLTEKGVEEAEKAGELLAKAGITFDQVFSSTQTRANRTAEIALDKAGQGEAFVARAGQFTLPTPETELAEITTPTIVIWGESDRVLPADHGVIFAENISGSELIRLEGVGHLPQAEAPDVVIDAIRQLATPDEDRP